MIDYHTIYSKQADQYEQLIGREDYQNNILPALQDIVSFEGVNVIELGAGTGRLTRLLAPYARTLHAFDLSPAMLQVAADQLPAHVNWQLAVADHRRIPLKGHVAEVVISGWSYCYLVVNHRETWQDELGKGLAEIKRLLRPGGTFIILETLGTGHETPFVHEGLADYYAYLEQAGFQKTWIRTDYHFTSLEEAQSATNFFFGEAMVQKVVANNWVILPECTGIWWRKI